MGEASPASLEVGPNVVAGVREGPAWGLRMPSSDRDSYAVGVGAGEDEAIEKAVVPLPAALAVPDRGDVDAGLVVPLGLGTPLRVPLPTSTVIDPGPALDAVPSSASSWMTSSGRLNGNCEVPRPRPKREGEVGALPTCDAVAKGERSRSRSSGWGRMPLDRSGDACEARSRAILSSRSMKAPSSSDLMGRPSLNQVPSSRSSPPLSYTSLWQGESGVGVPRGCRGARTGAGPVAWLRSRQKDKVGQPKLQLRSQFRMTSVELMPGPTLSSTLIGDGWSKERLISYRGAQDWRRRRCAASKC